MDEIMSEQNFKLMKVFGTSKMPKEIWDIVYEHQAFEKDGFKDYEVGYFVNEVESGDPANYELQSYEECKRLDQT